MTIPIGDRRYGVALLHEAGLHDLAYEAENGGMVHWCRRCDVAQIPLKDNPRGRCKTDDEGAGCQFEVISWCDLVGERLRLSEHERDYLKIKLHECEHPEDSRYVRDLLEEHQKVRAQLLRLKIASSRLLKNVDGVCACVTEFCDTGIEQTCACKACGEHMGHMDLAAEKLRGVLADCGIEEEEDREP